MATTGTRRDVRLDFFRGLALWFIFIDHVPSSAIGNLTFRNFGFSDATEIFVFISGYTAALVYGLSMARRGFLYMSLQVLKRCWQLYAAHILLFVFFIAQITWVSMRFGNASFIEELNVENAGAAFVASRRGSSSGAIAPPIELQGYRFCRCGQSSPLTSTPSRPSENVRSAFSRKIPEATSSSEIVIFPSTG